MVFILFVPAIFLLPYLAMQPELLRDAAAAGEFAKTDPKSIFLQIVAILPAHLLTYCCGVAGRHPGAKAVI